MSTCPNSNCLAQLPDSGNFCTRCGTAMVSGAQQEVIPPHTGYGQSTATVMNPDHAMARGFGQIFDLHPSSTFMTLSVNTMCFGADGVVGMLALPTGGADLPLVFLISAAAGTAVGYVTYLAQRKWDGDDHESAKIKALVTGILTAIPTGLPGGLFGAAALARMLWRGKR
jgi:hypothetical protein